MIKTITGILLALVIIILVIKVSTRGNEGIISGVINKLESCCSRGGRTRA